MNCTGPTTSLGKCLEYACNGTLCTPRDMLVSMWGEDDTLLLSESTVILYPRLGGGDGVIQETLTV